MCGFDTDKAVIMGLEYSIEAKKSASVFKQYRNDIDIFTEDTKDDVLFYVKLLQRLLADTNIKINDVYPLGNCNIVRSTCDNDTDYTRKKLYIIDGDINVVMHVKPSSPRLFVLDRYCIENYVIDKNSVYTVFSNLTGTMSVDAIKQKVDYDVLMQDLSEALVSFYLCYAIDEFYGQLFVAESVERFIDMKNMCIKKDEVANVLSKEKERLVKAGIVNKNDFSGKYNELCSIYKCNEETLMKIVCGKQIIRYVKCLVCKLLKVQINLPDKSWKYQFARFCDTDGLQPLKNEILKITA